MTPSELVKLLTERPPLPPSGPEMRSYTPSHEEQLHNWIKDITGSDKLAQAATYGSPVGMGAMMADQAAAGDLQGLAMAAMPIPGAGRATKSGKSAAKALADAIKPKGRRAAITAMNLREMSPEAAMEIARTEQHIIPQTDGGFVGAPAPIKSRADIDAMRNKYDDLVEGGQGGADWYWRTHAGVKEIAGSDPKRQHLLAEEYGITSPQSNPDTNMGFAMNLHNAYELGAPAKIAKTGQQAREYNAARDEGRDMKLGKKTGVFAGHVDPTKESPTTPANDIWQARAFGYTGRMDPKQNGMNKPFDRALTPQEHSFLDSEALLAVDRANKKQLGGRSNWTVGEIQASPWVRSKATGLMERYGLSDAEALKEARKTFIDSHDKYTAHATYEMTPGSLTGHHTDLIGSPERDAFSADPRAQWTNDENRDILYDALGMYQRPTLDATGVYTAPGGVLENNPAHVARPMVGFHAPVEGMTKTGKVKKGPREVHPNSRAAMNIAEANRAYFSAQNAGAWSKPIAGSGKPNAIMLEGTGGPLSPKQIEDLQFHGENRFGTPNAVDYGDNAVLANFGGDVDPKALSRALKSEQNEGLFDWIAPGVEAKPARMDSGYLGYEDAWASGKPGAVTAQLMQHMDDNAAGAPAAASRLENDPAFKQKVLDLYDQSVERHAMTMGDSKPNQLLQNARRIFAEEGYAGLRAAIDKGIVPAAVAIPFVQALNDGNLER
jgi:hypothetical protein